MSCAKFEPQWAYEWQIKDSDWAQMILKLAKDRTVSANTESMLPDGLHCTSHVVIERESQYEEEWFNGAENEKIRFDKIFWNENVCALSACLSEKPMQLFLITGKSAPHLSVTKATEQTWAALGLFVKKIASNTSETVTWRFVQDLQAVNSAVIARAARVPNPYTILSQIPQNAMYFTVVDLANAFFSVPVEEKSQFWFAFDFDNKGYTFTRLCQGYCESPTIYNEALRRSLEPLILSSGTALLQYVDDLLICARDEVTCVADTVTLLNHLAREGHKVSLTKLQFVKQEITFLGHTITPNSKAISEKRIQAIKDVPRPITKKQLLSFLGMCAYCRTFIPNYAFLEKPLRALTTGKGLRSCDKIYWPTEAQEAFANMKLQLAQAPTLGLPVLEKPFTQMVDEKHGFMSSVLLQTHGDRLRPVAYFSTKLDAVAAAELAVLASREFVGYCGVIIGVF